MTRIRPALATALLICAGAGAVHAAEDVAIVYDASGSMWGQIDGRSKVEIAREVMADLVNGWEDGTNLGLVAYGHRRQGDCTDIETLIAPGPLDKAGFVERVNAIRPVGKTPLSAAVRHAAELLSWRDNPATVVLISDGLETCNADPCALTAELAQQGVRFTAHVVGFDLGEDVSLACIAENTGGVFVPASNAQELQDALTQVQTVIESRSEPAPEPAPTETPAVTLTGPATVTTGATFDVSWSGTINPRDYITILPMGAKEGQSGTYIRVADDSKGTLTAPAETGMYELRYVLNEGAKTLATAPIEVVAPEVGVAGPATVTAGANFDVSWSDTINPRDYITILPKGAKEGQSGTYIRVADDSKGTLTAPAETGMYELRYVLNEGAKTLASVPIEVVGVSIDLTAPPAVRAGSKLTIGWTQSVNPRDYITIVPAGEAEGKHGGYVRVETAISREVTAPEAPGLYEIRYVLNEGAKTLGRKPLEVRPADAPMDDGAGLTVPASAAPGETVTITWTGGGTGTDERIALARKEQPDFTWLTAMTATDAKTLNLQMPQEPGLYEIRFLDLGEPSVLGRAVVEVR